jgi:3-keto-5-aminohexanoate cleavage enzyme
MNASGIKPELEVFDKGMIDMAMRLHKKGHILPPLHFNLVMGVNGGIGGTPRDLMFMMGSLPEGATYTVSGVGRFQLPLTTISMACGGHVRVGLEDNVFLDKGVLAKSNADFVARAVRIARELNRPIATPDEARKILSIRR